MRPFANLVPLIGDLHNHCGISYGHGSLGDALRNAAERLDFVSVTGHASWPDMPEPDDHNRKLVGFHREGFARLAKLWPQIRQDTIAFAAANAIVPFLGFEMHSLADGDVTIVYRDLDGDLLACDGVPALQDALRELNRRGRPVLAFPHHIGYRRGHRGINWDVFAPDVFPLVEIVSMHGCAEADDGPRPFLHTMGPADHKSTMRYGLSEGHRFGVIGSTDHHSAHPGSYGHGLAGVWAGERTREAIWEALLARRTWAMTGDRINFRFSIDGIAMGGEIERQGEHSIAIEVDAGAPVDCVDVIRDGEIIRRFSPYGIESGPGTDPVRTKITLELGWGPRNARYDWNARLSLSKGRILGVEPRFRGREIVSPADSADGAPASCYESHWRQDGSSSVSMTTVTYGNPTNSTPATQAICLDVEMPSDGHIKAKINGRSFDIPLERLLQGAVAEPMADMPATSVRFHRAPKPHECSWQLEMRDNEGRHARYYYARVRLVNGHYAWTSPIFSR
jgi:hypothetical protein